MKNDKKEKLILRIIVVILSLILLVILAYVIIKIVNKHNSLDENDNITNNEVIIESNGYSSKALSAMKELNVYEKIEAKEYSKTVEVMLENNDFEEKYWNEYFNIDYKEDADFTKNVNKLLDLNYSEKEINDILANEDEVINILLNMKYIDLEKLESASNYEADKLKRYLNYYNDNKYDEETVVTYVNIGLDLEGYSKYVSYSNDEVENDLTILVNKYHKMPDDYEPSDLTSLSYNNGYYKLRKEAAEAYEKLSEAAIEDNVIFYPFSAYRSFTTQTNLYNRYVAQDGKKEADTYSARPGFSEHQLGLAVDVRSSTLNDNLTDSDYKWMLNNSYKYGFIVRYPKGKQYITQFIEEPWHIRYLGVDLATKVHDSGLTYDEYYDLYMSEH